MNVRLCSLLGFSALVSFGAIGCHDGGGDQPAAQPDMAHLPDLAPPPPDMLLPDRDPTDHPPATQVTNHGGATIAAIEPYTIVWKGDDALAAKVDTFLSFLVQSDYWTGVTSEYGGSKGTPQGIVVLDDAAPATLDDDQMDGIINGLVTSGKVTTTPNTVLFFVVPQATMSTLFGEAGCFSYGGYHSETQMLINGRHQPYAVNLQCAGSAVMSQSGFDSLTVTLSHEAVEAQTDPHPFTAPGWLNEESPLGGEVGDLCVFSDTTITQPGQSGMPDTIYSVTTIYSEAAAKAGNEEPCQPAPAGQPFYSVAVNPPDVVITTDGSGNGDADAAYEPFAYGDVGMIRWTLEQPPGQGIKVTPSSGQAMPGETIRMKVHANSSARSGTYPLIIGVRADKADKTTYTASITVD